MREAIQSGALRPEDWDRYQAEVDRFNSSSMLSLTLFGAFSETELPTEDEEIEGLALQRHFGNITADSGRVLEMGVGQSGSQRHAVIRQAVQVG